MTSLALALLLAGPPAPPVPVQPGPQECATMDVRPGVAVPGDCYGVLMPRAYVLSYEAQARYADQLRASWPEPVTVPWYDRPGWARAEGGLLVGAIFTLSILTLNLAAE